MKSAIVPGSSSVSPTGRLLALVAAAAILLAALSGNSFSLHAGMSTMADDLATVADEVVHAGVTGDVGEATAGPATPLPLGSDAQHLLHLLGACLAVVAAATLALLWLLQRGRPSGGYPAVTAVPRPVPAPEVAERRPPALSPPTSSPVIRT